MAGGAALGAVEEAEHLALSLFQRRLGYALGRPGTERQVAATAFGWGGVGGSHAYADTAGGVAFALTKNWLTANAGAAEQVARIVTNAVANRAYYMT